MTVSAMTHAAKQSDDDDDDDENDAKVGRVRNRDHILRLISAQIFRTRRRRQ